MIFEILFSPLFAFVNWIIDKVPGIDVNSPSFDGLIDVMNIGFSIIPVQPVQVAFGCIIGWIAIHFIWNVVEFVYRKIPFIGIH